jgi:hypothetical protein
LVGRSSVLQASGSVAAQSDTDSLSHDFY